MKNIFFISLLVITGIVSCDLTSQKKIRGNGDIKTEIRSENGFQTIEVSGAINVLVTQDSAQSLKVEADANLMPHIETYMDKNTLIIRPERGYNLKPTKSIKVYVAGPRFRYFDVSGASSIRSENKLSSDDEFFVDVSGASDATIAVKSPVVGIKSTGASKATMTGETKELRIDCSGASHAKCFDLLSENADVELSGASGAQVFASVRLKANVSGAANLKYKGNAEVTQDVSGAGSVKKAE